MYSKKTTQILLESFAKREGWMPTYHTVDEVEEFKAYVESIVSKESNSRTTTISLIKPISQLRQKEIRRWIENEQVLCSADYSYWESRYAYIADEAGRIIRFENRNVQRLLDSIISDLDDKNLSKELLVLGSRQNGTSTKMTLRCVHRALFYPSSAVLISSPTNDIGTLMGRIVDTVYNQCPWWLVPIKIRRNKFDNDSVLCVQPIKGTTSMVNAWTPNCVYVPDIGAYRYPMNSIEEGLLRTVHSHSDLLMVLHGTKPEPSSWLMNIWKCSKENYPKGRSRLMPVFIPWFASSDIYPTKNWIKQFPVPNGWCPLKETSDHALRCERYAQSTPYMTKALGKNWKMPMEQKWYWEYTYLHAKAMDNLPNFSLNMAADDDEHIDNVELSVDDVDLNELFPSASDTQKKLR